MDPKLTGNVPNGMCFVIFDKCKSCLLLAGLACRKAVYFCDGFGDQCRSQVQRTSKMYKKNHLVKDFDI